MTPDAMIAELCEAVHHAQAENAELKQRLAHWDGMKDFFTQAKPGLAEGWYQSNFIPILAESLVGWFEEQGGVNYVELTVTCAQKGQYVLRLDRKGGKTPHELRADAEKRAEYAEMTRKVFEDKLNEYIDKTREAEAENARLREALADMTRERDDALNHRSPKKEGQ